MRVIAIGNQKGGVAKTTTCLSLGGVLAGKGQTVLLLDLDPQANLTMSLGIQPESLRTARTVFRRAGTDPTTHIRNFLNCVKTRKPANANSDVAARSHVVSHAAYIAWQLGRTLKFDPVKEEFLGNDEANRMRSRAMRDPWHI